MNPWASSGLLASLGLPLGKAGFHRVADGRLMRVVRLQLRTPAACNPFFLLGLKESLGFLWAARIPWASPWGSWLPPQSGWKTDEGHWTSITDTAQPNPPLPQQAQSSVYSYHAFFVGRILYPAPRVIIQDQI